MKATIQELLSGTFITGNIKEADSSLITLEIGKTKILTLSRENFIPISCSPTTSHSIRFLPSDNIDYRWGQLIFHLIREIESKNKSKIIHLPSGGYSSAANSAVVPQYKRKPLFFLFEEKESQV